MESSKTIAISRKKQGTFWSAVGYTTLFVAIAGLNFWSEVLDLFGLFAMIADKLPAILILLLVMATGPISAVVLVAGFSFLAIVDFLAIFLYEGFDFVLTLPFALAGLVFSIRRYVKVQGKAKGNIWQFVLVLGVMFVWVWFVGLFIGTVDALVRGTPEARSDAIMSLWYIIGIPILITILSGLSSRRAKRKR